jgi:hypothetical protein
VEKDKKDAKKAKFVVVELDSLPEKENQIWEIHSKNQKGFSTSSIQSSIRQRSICEIYGEQDRK